MPIIIRPKSDTKQLQKAIFHLFISFLLFSYDFSIQPPTTIYSQQSSDYTPIFRYIVATEQRIYSKYITILLLQIFKRAFYLQLIFCNHQRINSSSNFTFSSNLGFQTSNLGFRTSKMTLVGAKFDVPNLIDGVMNPIGGVNNPNAGVNYTNSS